MIKNNNGPVFILKKIHEYEQEIEGKNPEHSKSENQLLQEIKINSKINFSDAASGWAGWALAHSEFGSSINPFTHVNDIIYQSNK